MTSKPSLKLGAQALDLLTQRCNAAAALSYPFFNAKFHTFAFMCVKVRRMARKSFVSEKHFTTKSLRLTDKGVKSLHKVDNTAAKCDSVQYVCVCEKKNKRL